MGQSATITSDSYFSLFSNHLGQSVKKDTNKENTQSIQNNSSSFIDCSLDNVLLFQRQGKNESTELVNAFFYTKEELLKKQIDSFGLLKKDWDSYGAKKISKDAIKKAKKLICYLLSLEIKSPINVNPIAPNGIIIQLYNNDSCFQIEQYSNYCVVYFTYNNDSSS